MLKEGLSSLKGGTPMDDLERIQKKLIARNNPKEPQKKRMSALDKYVIFSFAMIIIFTVIALVYQFTSNEELSSTLIMSFYGVFGGELLMLAMIKRLKLKNPKEEDDERFDI